MRPTIAPLRADRGPVAMLAFEDVNVDMRDVPAARPVSAYAYVLHIAALPDETFARVNVAVVHCPTGPRIPAPRGAPSREEPIAPPDNDRVRLFLFCRAIVFDDGAGVP